MELWKVYLGWFSKETLLDLDESFLKQTLTDLAQATNHNVKDILDYS